MVDRHSRDSEPKIWKETRCTLGGSLSLYLGFVDQAFPGLIYVPQHVYVRLLSLIGVIFIESRP